MSDSEFGNVARAKRHVKAADAIVKEAERQGRRLTVEEGEKAWEHIHEAQRLRDDEELQIKIEQMRHANAEAMSPGAGAGSFAKALLDERFDLKTRPTVVVSAAKALGVKAPTTPSTGVWNETTERGIVPLGADRRFIYTNVPTVNAGEATAVSDFRITGCGVAPRVAQTPATGRLCEADPHGRRASSTCISGPSVAATPGTG